MFVQSLSNIWNIYHTPQLRLLSSNLSYAVLSQLHDSNEQRQTNIVQRSKSVFGNEMGKGACCHCTLSAERPFVHFKSTFTPQCSLSPRKWALCAYCIHSVWALREMDDVRFLSLSWEVDSLSRPLRNAKVQIWMNAIKVNLSAVIRVWCHVQVWIAIAT